MRIYVKFTKTTHQILSCHVMLASNSENFYFSPNSVLNIRKSYHIWGKFAQEQKSYRQKTNWGVENIPPVLIGLTSLDKDTRLIRVWFQTGTIFFNLMRQ